MKKNFERIMLATQAGEPFVDLKVGILVELNNKLYITADIRGYTTLYDIEKIIKQYKEEVEKEEEE